MDLGDFLETIQTLYLVQLAVLNLESINRCYLPAESKTWPQVLNCTAKVRTFKTRAQFFSIRTDPKPANNLFIYIFADLRM